MQLHIPADGFAAMYPSAREKLIEDLKALTPADLNAGPADDAAKSGLPIQNRDGVAVIDMEGPMIKGVGLLAARIGLTDTLIARRAVEAALADDEVQTIMLRIDSPGGSVDGLAELGDAVLAAREQKRVVAQTDGMAASAAYYVASQASAIYAQRMDLIGSLGTRMVVADVSGMAKQIGADIIPIDTAPADRPFKSAGVPGTKVTETQIADFQRIVNAFGADFRSVIERGRAFTAERVEQIFDGRVWPAPEALGLGLIDGIQTLEQTLEAETAAASSPGRSRTARAKAAMMARGG